MDLLELVKLEYKDMCSSIFKTTSDLYFEKLSALISANLLYNGALQRLDNFLKVSFKSILLPETLSTTDSISNRSVININNNEEKALLLYVKDLDLTIDRIEKELLLSESHIIYLVLPHQQPNYKIGQRYVIDKILTDGILRKCTDVSIEPIYNSDLGYEYVYRYREGIYVGKKETQFKITTRLFDEIIHDMVQNRSNSSYKASKILVDGDVKFRLSDPLYNLRCIIYRTIFGPGITIRFLAQKNPFYLNTLGFNDKTVKDLESLSSITSGLSLISGVVGSGKGTTVNAIALKVVEKEQYRSISVDMPTEYLGEYAQIEPQSEQGLYQACNAIKKMDVNFVYLNEIATQEAALAAYNLVVSGMHVITTVHSNRVYRIMYKLNEMMGDLYLNVIPFINMISYQDKFSNTCSCQSKIYNDYYDEDSNEMALLKYLKLTIISQPIGCEKCNNTKINRIGINVVSEHIFFTSELKDKLLKANIHQQSDILKEESTKFGNLEDVYREKLISGEILIDEVVAKLDTWRGE